MLLEGRLIETGYPVRLELINDRIGSIELIKTASDIWIAPGFFDIQVNGYKGFNVNGPNVTPEEIVGLTQALWQQGITTFCPTIITQTEDRICQTLRAITLACESNPLVAHSIPCIHVEGPYISSEDGPRGAHQLKYVRAPDIAEYYRWQEAASGNIGLITVAPEHPGMREYIRTIVSDKVIISIGHTAASAEQIRGAVDAGARLSTHLGNGSHALLQRHPNYIWEQLAEDRLMASFICDGHHLPASVMKAMFRAKGIERSILISDAVAIAGLQPGIHETILEGKIELLPNGRLQLWGTPYLAGSASALPECIANVVRSTEISLREAVQMATVNPARLLGQDINGQRGSLRSGAVADLTLFRFVSSTGALHIETTIVHGTLVYGRENTHIVP